MPMTPRQVAFLQRPLTSLGKLSPQAQNELIAIAHKFRDPGAEIKITPKNRKNFLRMYTISDVFERWKQYASDPGFWANPTGLTYPHGHNRTLIDKLVKAGFTRFDHPWLPQATLTLKVMRTRPKEEWLDTPLCFLGTLPRASLGEIAYYVGKADDLRRTRDSQIYSVSVRDFFTMCDEREDVPSWRLPSPRQLWRNHKKSMTNTQKLLYKLGFAYEDSVIMRYGTDRRAIERLVKRHQISVRTARIVLRIAKGEGWRI